MEEKARLVEKYIISCYTEPDLSKILTVVVIPAVPPGENFLSVIWRIEVKIQLKNGEVKERNLILKELPFEGDKRKAAITNNTFTREVETYELVLRKMDEIITRFNCDFERPWGNLILHNNYKSLLLEDLKFANCIEIIWVDKIVRMQSIFFNCYISIQTGEPPFRAIYFTPPTPKTGLTLILHLNMFISSWSQRFEVYYPEEDSRLSQNIGKYKIASCKCILTALSTQKFIHIMNSINVPHYKPLGYEPADKIEGLTLQEAEVVFKSLGRFHAASKAALYHDLIKLSDLKPRLACRNPKYIEDYIVRPIRFMSQSIDESWGPQWQGIPAKLDKPTEKIVNKMMDIGGINETRFNTIVHGDLWTNNIMFQRHRSGEAKSVKFVDFQLSFYSTVAWDITYLSFTSLSYDLRKQHLNHLLQIYINNLQNDLRKYNFPEDKIPSFEYLLDEMKRLRFFGLVTILLYVAVILTGVTGVKEDANILMNASAHASQVPSIYQSEIFRDTVGEDILELLNEGVLE